MRGTSHFSTIVNKNVHNLGLIVQTRAQYTGNTPGIFTIRESHQTIIHTVT